MKIFKHVMGPSCIFYAAERELKDEEIVGTNPDFHHIASVPTKDGVYDYLVGLTVEEGIEATDGMPLKHFKLYPVPERQRMGTAELLDSFIHPYRYKPYKEVDAFFDEIRREIVRHFPEKGETWKTMDLDDLVVQMADAYRALEPLGKYMDGGGGDPHQLVDLGALVAFVYMRHMRRPDVCPHCKRPKDTRNPSGYCDHLHYPEACPVCKARENLKKSEAHRGPLCTCGGSLEFAGSCMSYRLENFYRCNRCGKEYRSDHEGGFIEQKPIHPDRKETCEAGEGS